MALELHELLRPGQLADTDVDRLLGKVGFADIRLAQQRLAGLCQDQEQREALARCLPMLLAALSEAATPDGSLINFERFVQSVSDRADLFRYLAHNPRAVEILVKLFVGSQYLTQILLRNPEYLELLTNHKRIAEIKSRQQFIEEELESTSQVRTTADKMDALRRYQHWELLRIGACDSFGLLDLRSVTVQLSLLADSLVQSALTILAADLKISPDGFAVLGFGKLGGEELNYSSDIDLVFIADKQAERFWPLGQRLIKALMEPTSEGFLYRVDMRLRPWGRSGALVNTVDGHISYLKQHGMLWEKQALLKARRIAGDERVAEEFLKRVEPLIYHNPVEELRTSIAGMKQRIEAELERQGRTWGEVKSGEGSIRDIEFVTQFLQLAHGGKHPQVRSFNTLDALVRLAEFGFIHGEEFRQLTTGYVSLRTIEHSLQLMHHKQTHSLPDDRRELAYLARRLDYPDAEHFLLHYRRLCQAVRAIFKRHIEGLVNSENGKADSPADMLAAHLARMEPSYTETFTEEQVQQHVILLQKLAANNIVEVAAERLDDERWQVTIVGFNYVGNLSMICGLLFVYGFDIVEGNAFTDQHFFTHHSAGSNASLASSHAQRFVDVFVVRQPASGANADTWRQYAQELGQLLSQLGGEKRREAHGVLIRRVADALRKSAELPTTLLPVEIDLDNEASSSATVLHIRAEDTIGFLYELANALALAGIDISRLIVSSAGNRVFDTLYVTDVDGERLDDPARMRQLRSAVVLIKHFTHLLPRSPNPEAALLRFQDFLEQLFRQPDWLEELAGLERSDVLDALARLLGVSSFLWEDFLRLQHENLFPVVKDIEALAQRKSKDVLRVELAGELRTAKDNAERRERLNAFKDREMFRTDMRHIVGHISEFGQFSDELTDLAEVVVDALVDLCHAELRQRYGIPQLGSIGACPLAVCALGKCGGRELGFASDIELMFVYEGSGKTTGPEVITTTEYYLKFVETFTQSLIARREGIFQIDLRLRPYGKAGSLAVSLDAFEEYFAPNGAAWPYERQALVKLRPISGDPKFGSRIVGVRDRLVYTGDPFDVLAMRAMRERQNRQLVQAGTFNAKLSPGGLVDSEYLVQGLQITHGQKHPELRATNTLEAMAALESIGILSPEDHARLREAYIFQRQLIDALRMVRGNARDLAVPAVDSEEFNYLARRLGYEDEPNQLLDDLQRHTAAVQELTHLLDPPAR